ncbi:MAG: c-type cytochrome [Melioribacteraceae bacterium]
MNIKYFVVLLIVAVLFVNCGDSKDKVNSAKKSVKKIVKKETVKKIETTGKIDFDAPALDNKGVGKIKNLKLSALDEKLAASGKETYKKMCTACHKFKKRYIGPALLGVTKRRSPEWIMNMILDPEKMVAEDPLAKALITEYNAPMANQQLKEEEARAILEFFRLKDK